MKKTLIIAMTVCMGMAILFSGTGITANPEPYVLGFSPEITGRRAELGIANKRGAMIALDKINAAGGINGRQLKAIFYDGQSQPVACVKNTKKLIDVDRAIACMGYTSVGGTLASAQTANSASGLSKHREKNWG